MRHLLYQAAPDQMYPMYTINVLTKVLYIIYIEMAGRMGICHWIDLLPFTC